MGSSGCDEVPGEEAGSGVFADRKGRIHPHAAPLVRVWSASNVLFSRGLGMTGDSYCTKKRNTTWRCYAMTMHTIAPPPGRHIAPHLEKSMVSPSVR